MQLLRFQGLVKEAPDLCVHAHADQDALRKFGIHSDRSSSCSIGLPSLMSHQQIAHSFGAVCHDVSASAISAAATQLLLHFDIRIITCHSPTSSPTGCHNGAFKRSLVLFDVRMITCHSPASIPARSHRASALPQLWSPCHPWCGWFPAACRTVDSRAVHCRLPGLAPSWLALSALRIHQHK